MKRSFGLALAAFLPWCGELHGAQAIYRFDSRADRFLEAFFPRRVAVSGLTNAYVSRAAAPVYADLDAVYERTLWGTNLAVAQPSWLELDDPLDSYWVSASRNEARLRSLFDAVATPELGALVDGLAGAESRFTSVLEKALFQRDVWQVFGFCAQLRRLALPQPEAARREALLGSLAGLLRRVRLADREYEQLLELRAGRADARRFAESPRWDLAEDYLPRRLLADAPGWHALPFVEQASRHFRFFGGRSFIRVFIRPPGLSAAEFYGYWDRLNRRFGPDIHLRTGQPPLPARTELLLVRTFGVFLEDGSYVDSTFPEEVLLRLVKHRRPRLDLATSDYRGTLLYQYKLSRRDLLADGAVLGLRRIGDDAPQYYGFFAEAPDPYNSYSDTLSTMRFNCISCHSEHQYGVGTVFSMTRKPVLPPTRPLVGLLQDGLLEATGRAGRFRLLTEEARCLSALTGESALPAETSRDGDAADGRGRPGAWN